MRRVAITLKSRAADLTGPPPPALELHVIHAPDGPRVWTLGDAPLEIGRDVDPERHLLLDDPSVSRTHARLELDDPETYLVVDCDSSNGVFVNGARVNGAARVRRDDVIRIGDSILVVAAREAADADALDDGDPLGLIGESPAIASLRRTLRKIAPTPISVLVIGPTGTGKEVVARAVHARSGRDGAFVALNCAALTPTMVEDALFGHVKGAFTGAVASAPGAFVAADRGTLFLDEIGDMPLEVQPKLLRALESGEVIPVGTSTARVVDVRIVAATNVPLADATARGTFRDDLYARLAGITLATPPLAARREDLLRLWEVLLPEPLRGRPRSADFVEALCCYAWPRNVRELQRLAERVAALHPEATTWELVHLEPDLAGELAQRRRGELPARAPTLEPAPASATEPAAARARGPVTREELLALLAEHDGRVVEIARVVGRNRKQIYRWMDQYGIARGTGRRGDVPDDEDREPTDDDPDASA